MDAYVAQIEQLLTASRRDLALELVRAHEHSEPTRYSLGMAVIACSAGDASAVEHAQRAYYAAPDEPIVLEYLAVSAMMMGDTASAEFHARRALASDGSLRRLGALANILLGAGKFADANRTYRTMLERDPLNSQALNGVATALYKLGDNESALQYFARAFEVDPHDLKPIESIASMCMEAGRLLGAISFAQSVRDKVVGDLSARLALELTVLELTRSLTAHFPPPVVARFTDDAVHHLVATAREHAAGVQLAVVRKLLECNRLDEAGSLTQALAHQSLGATDRGDLLFLTGRIAERKGDSTSALEGYRSCLETTPDHWQACCSATSILLERCDGESLVEIRSLLQRVPTDVRMANPPVLINEARYLKRVGRNADARKCLEQVLQLTKGGGSLGQIAAQVLQDLR